MENLPLWFKVLCHFNDRDYFSNGLTIPFLLGVSTVKDHQAKITALDDFLSIACTGGLPRKISLQKCANIGKYVVGIIDNETMRYPYGKSVYNNVGNIYFTDNSVAEVENIESLYEILSKHSQKKVESGSYSFNGGCSGDYSQTEKLRIIAATECRLPK